jgi:uncharacterized membrane protein YedE/YeeE
MRSIAARYLDPGTSMGEVLFGLIMTLTFTLGAGLVIDEEGRAGAREMLEPVTEPAVRQKLYDDMLRGARRQAPASNAVRSEDLKGALAAGWLVFACSFPAILPFIVLDDPRLALRISNAILIGLLFFVGHRLAKRHTLARPVLTGLVFALIGVFLVAIAIPLGG